MRRFSIMKVIGCIVMVVAGILIIGAVVMGLWNALMPVIFHLPVIGFWQALGLLILAKILFGGFRGPRGRGQWKNKMKQRWMNMTPEEKERLRQEWGSRCGGRFAGKEAFFSRGASATQTPQGDRNAETQTNNPNPQA